jgi:hypothetical protein
MSVDYARLLTDLEEELAGITTEFVRLDKKRVALEETIAGLRKLDLLEDPPLKTLEPTATVSDIPRHAFRNMMTIPAAVKYLKMVGKPKTNRELVDALLAGGLATKAKDPRMTIRSILLREAQKKHRTFTWSDGQWGLMEWIKPKIDLVLDQ